MAKRKIEIGYGNGATAAMDTSKKRESATVTPIRPVVRVGRSEDETEVCRLMLLSHAENGLFPANHSKVLYFIRIFLNANRMPPTWTGPRGVIAVIGPVGGKLEGFAMVGIGQMWYSDKRYLEEYAVFVDPDMRRPNRGHAAVLNAWLKSQSDRTGLPLITGIMSTHRTEAKCRLYRIRYQKLGEYFCSLPAGKKWHSDELLDELYPRG